jgi:hypothetical protein
MQIFVCLEKARPKVLPRGSKLAFLMTTVVVYEHMLDVLGEPRTAETRDLLGPWISGHNSF